MGCKKPRLQVVEGNPFSVPGTHVTIEGFLVCGYRGEVLACTDATFDFSKVPPELHSTVADFLLSFTRRYRRHPGFRPHPSA